MIDPAFVTAFGQFGPLGLFILYLVWREKALTDYQTGRTAADRELAKSLGELTATIQEFKR